MDKYDSLRTRLGLYEAHKEVTRGHEDPPNRWQSIGQNAHEEVPSIFGIGRNPQNLEGSLRPIHSCKETRSRDRGNIQKVVPRVQQARVLPTQAAFQVQKLHLNKLTIRESLWNARQSRFISYPQMPNMRLQTPISQSWNTNLVLRIIIFQSRNTNPLLFIIICQSRNTNLVPRIIICHFVNLEVLILYFVLSNLQVKLSKLPSCKSKSQIYKVQVPNVRMY